MTNISMIAALRPLADIADAFDRDVLMDLSVSPRKGSAASQSDEEIVQGRGGRTLLTLGHAIAARTAIRTKDGLAAALAPLAAIANAYDANELDDEARKFWGVDGEHTNDADPARIELVNTDGGGLLVSLAHALHARDAFAPVRAVA
ncbi:hypothetical protein ACOI1H_14700 [Loktanella sp. DJP18]|uniref:hypothetical protein n=1 Tax=Loktanella sp. DJP18 TaxID=3409788 RepID=UPI003BB7F3B9